LRFPGHLSIMSSNKQKQTTPLNDFSARGAPCPPTHKVFIQRDYSEGTQVRFQSKFPTELEGKVERDKLEYTINTLNEVYSEGEKMNCSSCCEGCFACLTAYLLYCCTDTHYEKVSETSCFKFNSFTFSNSIQFEI